MTAIYCVDTLSLILGYNRRYPPEVFPSFWISMAALFSEGRAVCITQVRDEISKENPERKDNKGNKLPSLTSWAKANVQFYEPSDSILVVKELMNHPDLSPFQREQMILKPGSTKNPADPYVIGYAKVHDLTVITEENRRSPKNIPFACEKFSVPQMNLIELMQTEKWEY